eukprot:UN05349
MTGIINNQNNISNLHQINLQKILPNYDSKQYNLPTPYLNQYLNLNQDNNNHPTSSTNNENENNTMKQNQNQYILPFIFPYHLLSTQQIKYLLQHTVALQLQNTSALLIQQKWK